MVCCSVSGAMRDAIIRGKNSRLQNIVFRNNTGITALFFSAVFLNMSYMPNSDADMNASISHICFLLFCGAKLRFFILSAYIFFVLLVLLLLWGWGYLCNFASVKF